MGVRVGLDTYLGRIGMCGAINQSTPRRGRRMGGLTACNFWGGGGALSGALSQGEEEGRLSIASLCACLFVRCGRKKGQARMADPKKAGFVRREGTCRGGRRPSAAYHMCDVRCAPPSLLELASSTDGRAVCRSCLLSIYCQQNLLPHQSISDQHSPSTLSPSFQLAYQPGVDPRPSPSPTSKHGKAQ